MLNNIEKEDFEFILNDKTIDWSCFAGKTILITGSTGLIAPYIVKTLLFLNSKKIQDDIKIICPVRNIHKAKNKYTDYLSDKNLVFIEQDIINPLNINTDIDYIIHAASMADPKYFYSNPVDVINANTLGTHNLLSLARDKNVKSFLYFSSGEVYGNIFETSNNVKESDYGIVNPLDIRSCYSESKRLGENMCVCWHSQYNIPVKIVRPSHTYGPTISLDDGRVFASFVKNILNNEDIILNSDGKAKRCFLYLTDAVCGYFKVLLDGENGNAYNVSNDYEISISDLADIIIKLSDNKDLKVKINQVANAASSKSSHGLIDNSKLKALGWSPKIKEQEGFKKVIKYFKEVKNVAINN